MLVDPDNSVNPDKSKFFRTKNGLVLVDKSC